MNGCLCSREIKSTEIIWFSCGYIVWMVLIIVLTIRGRAGDVHGHLEKEKEIICHTQKCMVPPTGSLKANFKTGWPRTVHFEILKPQPRSPTCSLPLCAVLTGPGVGVESQAEWRCDSRGSVHPAAFQKLLGRGVGWDGVG